MLEQGLEKEIYIPSVTEYSQTLDSYLTTLYPQMILPTPLNEFDIESKKLRMNYEEREFAHLLLTRDLVVYREPEIRDCNRIPDFFVFNPRHGNGKLVEITLSSCMTRDKRKRGQIKDLSMCGIPLVVLYKEQMESIKKRCWNRLF